MLPAAEIQNEPQGDTCSTELNTPSTGSSPRNSGLSHGENADPLKRLLRNNRLWSAARLQEEPGYFNKLCKQQNPEYLWIGCSDSRVPANQILGLEPGEVFVQRNVGNQAAHTDLNCMSCLEYSVKELKVRNVIVCGHYGCGAVKAALRLPSKTQGLVNCWISDIRDCRNQHRAELMALPDLETQIDRLCELNVLHQTFNVCTSPVVQAAWDQGQELHIYGVVYSLKDGLIKKLVGPISKNGDFELDQSAFEEQCTSYVPGAPGATKPEPAGPVRDAMETGSLAETASPTLSARNRMDDLKAYMNTRQVSSRLAEHVGWSEVPDQA